MREIKFRYRFEKNGKIDTVIIFQEAVENKVIWNYKRNGWKILSRDLHAGFKDKNGKEIYENDIYININDTWKEKYTGDLHEIIFHHYSDIDYHAGNGSKEWEIIGNKWENPELWEEAIH